MVIAPRLGCVTLAGFPEPLGLSVKIGKESVLVGCDYVMRMVALWPWHFSSRKQRKRLSAWLLEVPVQRYTS